MMSLDTIRRVNAEYALHDAIAHLEEAIGDHGKFSPRELIERAESVVEIYRDGMFGPSI